MPSNSVKLPSAKPPKENRSHGLGITLFSAIILVIIVVTFVGAPVVSKVSEQPTAVFGTYDGAPIEFIQGNAFAQHVEQLNRFYEQFSQGNNNIELQRQLVWRQAFEQTAVQVALKREADVAGIVVTDAQVDKALTNHPSYLKDGKFSEELYRTTGSSDRFRYRQETKSNLIVQQYAGDHIQGPMLSSATQDFIASMAYPQKKFSYVTFTDADYPQALVADYAAKNKGLFRSIDVSKITITTSEGDANKVHDEAVKGDKSFAELAKAYSKDTLAEAGGAVGVRHYYELKPDFPKSEDLDKVFSLSKGAVSAVIKGDKVWTIYKVNAPATEADLASADTLAVVRAYLGRSERGLIEDNLEAQAKAFVETAKGDFAGAAKKAGRTVTSTDWVSLNFGNHPLFPSINEASKETTWKTLAANEDFFKKAFRLSLGQISDPILASPAVLVVKVDALKMMAMPTETPVSAAQVQSEASTERGQQLEQQILTSPKFKDQFQAEFSRFFPAR